jgi:TetR/AcrR family transcriptional repressor of nem operon
MFKNIFCWQAMACSEEDRMPYPKDHKEKTRARIVEAARRLFNTHGYDRVTLDMVMASAGMTRGGFYAHFRNKESLFAEAVDSFLQGRGAQWRGDAGIDPNRRELVMAERMIDAYLSDAHLADLAGQCPMIALSSDVARASEEVRESYQKLLSAMIWLFEVNTDEAGPEARQKAMAISALCVGGMILARTLPESDLASDVRRAAHAMAREFCSPGGAAVAA